MFSKQKIAILILISFSYQISFSQNDKKEKDSSKSYQNIQSYSKKNKYTHLLHKLIFEPINPKKKKPIIEQKKQVDAEGKIIRNIIITTLDPFGYSDTDSTKTPDKWIERTGNLLHLKTKNLAIKNLLLFKKNTPYSSVNIDESERIIRSQKFVSRVTISEKLTAKESDSVDVFIRVLDSWSSLPKASVSSTKASLGLSERNIFGIGHQFDYKFTNRSSDGKNANDLAYTIPNIRHTFIKTIVQYRIDLDDNYSKSISIERPFYSPLTKWAGGIYLDQQFKTDTLQGLDLQYVKQNFKYSSHDFWIAKAFQIFKGNTLDDKTTNLIISGRLLNKNYIESPEIDYDPTKFYADETFLLSGIGINTRKFTKDKYIFKNGIIEDVPVGRIYGITYGYQNKNNNWRPYIGSQISFGKYYKWGFLSTNFEAGTFFNKSKTEQTTFSFQANYFTNLIDIGNWKLRQFIKPQVIIGLNRQKSIGDQLNINEESGIQGFNSPIYGTNKTVLTLQTQAYSPWNIGGFRLNPYFNYSIALLGNSQNELQKNKAYSKIGIGLIINNDYLVFSAFQISLAYYPVIPFQGDNVFKTNAFQTSDFGIQNFELAKPRIVPYQ